jgi:hypothetical protein
MSFAQEIKIISPTFQISGTLVILCPKEREREIERERTRKYESAGDYISKPPGPK